MAGAKHGGAETAFVDMCIALHEAGEQIEVATRANDARVSRLQQAGIRVHELPFGGKLDIFTRRALKKIIRAFEPQIVQTWMSRASRHTPNRKDCKGCPPFLVFSRLGNYYKLKNFASTDYYVTITKDVLAYLHDNSVAPERTRHINNFAETEQADAPLDRAEFHTPEDAPLLLSLGRLHDAKAFDTLMKALTLIPKAHSWIAGEGPDREKLEALRAELGLEARVTFLGWRNDRAALFKTADICVFPSRFEPFGTVFVQAWAQETPLVTTDSDGPRQNVRHEEDALMTPVDDVEALANAIQRLIDAPELTRRLVRNGRQRYLSEFTKEHCLNSYLGFYKEMLEREGMA